MGISIFLKHRVPFQSAYSHLYYKKVYPFYIVNFFLFDFFFFINIKCTHTQIPINKHTECLLFTLQFCFFHFIYLSYLKLILHVIPEYVCPWVCYFYCNMVFFLVMPDKFLLLIYLFYSFCVFSLKSCLERNHMSVFILGNHMMRIFEFFAWCSSSVVILNYLSYGTFI